MVVSGLARRFKGMMKRRSSRFEVEWVTVSYRTLLRWGTVLAGLGLVAGAIWLVFRLEASGELRDVERMVAAVARQIRAAREGESERTNLESLASAEQSVQLARKLLAERDPDAARAAIEDARNHLRMLGEAPKEQARLLRVEGQVEVKSVGSLDWTEARVGVPLDAGDLVRTASGSAAQVIQLDGSTYTLGADTVLRIMRSQKDVESGRTDVAVAVNSGQLTMATSELQPEGSRSEVQTADNVRASVDRNSIVGVGVDEAGSRSRIDVFEGLARVQAGETALEIRASEGVDISASGVEHRRLPATPQLIGPPQHKLLLTRDLEKRPLELEWESARDARAYRIELARTPLFSSLLREVERHPTNFLSLEGIGVGRYYWRVTGLDRDGVSGGPSAAGVFQISDALPEGEPPPLKLTNSQPLGEGMFLFEGKTKPGVFVTIDDGARLFPVQPSQSGAFRQVVTVTREGAQVVTITARSSEGLETQIKQGVEVHFQ